MKRTTALLLSFGTTALADIMQLVSTLPECTIECIGEGAATFDCEVTDFDCLCPQLEALTAETAPCFVDAGCSMAEIGETAGIVSQICEENGQGPDSISSDTSDSTETTEDDDDSSPTPESTTQEDGSDPSRRISFVAVAAIAAAAMAAVNI